jgi:4-hydroxy-4-methyl-2-oxoglutarate aldolase
MIHDPPLLKIRRGFPRPTAAVLAGFAGVPTGYLVDAMGGRGCVDHRIKPLVADGPILVGVAMTCHAGPADNLALHGAIDAAQPGDVIFAATDAFTETAVTGDLMLGMARNRGVAGFVTDGMIRDLVGVLDVGLPVYCAGVTANSPARSGPGTVATAVLGRLDAIRAAEAEMMAKVAAGLELPDSVRALLRSERVEEIPD